MLNTDFLLYRYFVVLNYKVAYFNMFGTSKYLRFYPRLNPHGSSPSVSFSRLFSNSMPHNKPAEETVEEQMEKLKNNPYYAKYAAKIEGLQKKDPTQFRELLAKLVKKSDTASLKLDDLSKKETDNETKPNVAAESQKEIKEVVKQEKRTGLDAIVKLDLLKNLSPEDIKELWVSYYADKDAVCAVIPAESYMVIKSVCEMFPLFVYPIPRDDGFEMFVGQFADDNLHFTSLHNYQKLQEFAPDQLTIHHYTELQQDKDIVLMSSMVNDNSLTVSDAQMLCYLVQHYCVNHPNLMKDFNQNPGNFSIQKVIDALDVSDLLGKNKPA